MGSSVSLRILIEMKVTLVLAGVAAGLILGAYGPVTDALKAFKASRDRTVFLTNNNWMWDGAVNLEVRRHSSKWRSSTKVFLQRSMTEAIKKDGIFSSKEMEVYINGDKSRPCKVEVNKCYNVNTAGCSEYRCP